MSHFTCVILTKEIISTENLRNICAVLLEPFNQHNAESKWDWWELGGHWEHHLLGKNNAAVDDLLTQYNPEEHTPFSFLTPEGEWLERGTIGRLKTIIDKNIWQEQARNIYEKYSEYMAIWINCHI